MTKDEMIAAYKQAKEDSAKYEKRAVSAQKKHDAAKTEEIKLRDSLWSFGIDVSTIN